MFPFCGFDSSLCLRIVTWSSFQRKMSKTLLKQTLLNQCVQSKTHSRVNVELMPGRDGSSGESHKPTWSPFLVCFVTFFYLSVSFRFFFLFEVSLKKFRWKNPSKHYYSHKHAVFCFVRAYVQVEDGAFSNF